MTQENNQAKTTRAAWDDVIIAALMSLSKRSDDIHTQHAALIVDSSYKPLGLGFNGYSRDIDTSILPKERPGKYDFMIHAEENAIYHATGPLKGATIYCTGWPCIKCANRLYHNGVRKWKVLDSYASCVKDEKEALDLFYRATNRVIWNYQSASNRDLVRDTVEENTLFVEMISPDLSFLFGIVEQARGLGLIRSDRDSLQDIEKCMTNLQQILPDA